MIDFINSITTEANNIWLALTALFFVVGLIAFGIFVLIGGLSGERGRSDAGKRILTIIVCLAGVASASSLVAWAMEIGG